MDRSRRSVLGNASLRVHPFINSSMGNTSTKLSAPAADDSKLAGPSSYTQRAPLDVPQTVPPAPVQRSHLRQPSLVTTTENRQQPSPPRIDTVSPVPPMAPPLITIQASPVKTSPSKPMPSITVDAPDRNLSPPPARRGIGLVRKLSFRSGSRHGHGGLPNAQRSMSVDHTLSNLAVPADTVEYVQPHAAGPSKPSAISRSTSMDQTASRIPSRSTRTAAAPALTVSEPPSTLEASTRVPPTVPEEIVQRTPPPTTSRLPRSPHRSPGVYTATSSATRAQRRSSVTSARRAEKEWRAKLQSLGQSTPPSPKGAVFHAAASGPRPPPRRTRPSVDLVQRSGPDPSLDRPRPFGVSRAAPLPPVPGSISSLGSVTAPRTGHGMSGGASTISIPHSAFGSDFNKHRRAPSAPRSLGSGHHAGDSKASTSLMAVMNEPSSPRQRLPLAPIAQEPLTVIEQAELGLRPMVSTPQLVKSSRKQASTVVSEAPSTALTFGQTSRKTHTTPSPSSSARTLESTWQPDERVVATRASVPDFARAQVVSGSDASLKSSKGSGDAIATPPRRGLTLDFAHIPAERVQLPPRPHAAAPSERGRELMAEEILDAQARAQQHAIHQRVKPVAIEAAFERAAAPSPRASPPAMAGNLPPRRSSREASLDVARGMPSPSRSPPPTVSASETPASSPPLATSLAPASEWRNLTPGLETGRRPRKQGLPMADLQRWLAQTATA